MNTYQQSKTAERLVVSKCLLLAAILCASSLSVYAGDSYTLNKTDSSTSAITKYSVDKTTGQTTAEYYNVDLNTTSYGSGSTTKTYSVTIPSNRNVNISFNHGTTNARLLNPTSSITGSFVNLSGYASGDAINSTVVASAINANFFWQSRYNKWWRNIFFWWCWCYKWYNR